jgi:hypothetical protein
MSDDETTNKVDVQFLLEELLNSAQEWNRLLQEANDAGFETGRAIGIVEAYETLNKAGYVRAAKIVKGLLDEQFYFMRSKGEA